jgi:hypothetical protein
MGAHHQDGNFRILRLDVAHQFQSAAVFERDVRDHKVRLEPFDGFERLAGVFLLTANLHVLFAIDQLSHSVSDHRVIVHQENSRPFVF